METTKEFEELKEALLQAWRAIKDSVNSIIDALFTKDKKRSVEKQKWHITKDTTKHSQVINRKPMFACIRNNI